VTAQPEGKPVILTAAEAAFIKETLYRCYATLDRACFASLAARAAAQDAAWAAAGEHVTLNKVLGDASLAMDYIDFAAPAPARRGRGAR
jgi:hypothetical protein